MNRRERRHMEKRLGLTKHKKNLTKAEKFEQVRLNIEEGKKLQEDMKEVRRRQDQGSQDQIDSQRISSIATDLMVNEGLGWVDAQEKAKEVYQKEVDSVSKEEK